MQVNSELHWDSTPLTTRHEPASTTPISEARGEAQREEERKKTEVVNNFYYFFF
jgi:hypothetical protein